MYTGSDLSWHRTGFRYDPTLWQVHDADTRQLGVKRELVNHIAQVIPEVEPPKCLHCDGIRALDYDEDIPVFDDPEITAPTESANEILLTGNVFEETLGPNPTFLLWKVKQ